MPLVTTKEMFAKAYAGGYAIGAFNVNNMEMIQGIVEAGKEEKSVEAKAVKNTIVIGVIITCLSGIVTLVFGYYK